jgi:hypothetical protein
VHAAPLLELPAIEPPLVEPQFDKPPLVELRPVEFPDKPEEGPELPLAELPEDPGIPLVPSVELAPLEPPAVLAVLDPPSCSEFGSKQQAAMAEHAAIVAMDLRMQAQHAPPLDVAQACLVRC